MLSHGHPKGRRKSGTWHTALYKDVRKVGRGTWDFIEMQESGTWHTALYKDVREMFFFIVITATRRLKRHTPCKTNRQKNGQETVLLSFRGILGGHKADPPRLPPQERLQNTDLLPLESTALFQLTAKQFYCFTAPIA